MNQRKRSLITGLLYISLALLGPVALLIIPAQFDVDNVTLFAQDHLWLVVIWIVLELMIIGIEVILTINLYQMFKVYHKVLSFVASIFRFAVVLIMSVGVIFLSLILFNQGSGADMWIENHQTFVYIWQLWFSVHVFILGLMILKNNKTYWKYLGCALLIGAFGYLLDATRALTHVDNPIVSSLSTILLIFITIGEIGMSIGLIKNKIITLDLI